MASTAASIVARNLALANATLMARGTLVEVLLVYGNDAQSTSICSCDRPGFWKVVQHGAELQSNAGVPDHHRLVYPILT